MTRRAATYLRQLTDGEGLMQRLLVENEVLCQPSSVSLLPLVRRMVSKPQRRVASSFP